MPRTGRRTILTPEIAARIVAGIRAGAYDYIAAEAFGVSQNTFYEWLARGAGRDPRGKKAVYANFAKQVMEAKAQARMNAELAVAKDSPFNYLRYGPGREKPGRPGWTESQEIEANVNVHGIVAVTAAKTRILGELDRLAARNGEGRVAKAAG